MMMMKIKSVLEKAHRTAVVLASLLCVLQIASRVVCLKISSIEIPAAVSNGSQVTFVCNYRLSKGDQLYSIKWYKNYVEFYRFQPSNQPQTTTTNSPPANAEDSQRTSGEPTPPANLKTEFELDGINLDLARSNATHVHLKQVSLASEATYKCEVSADSPSFETISLERQMKVYVLPKQKLYIVDNLQSSSAPPGGGQPSSPDANNRQAHHSHQPVYNLNDQINLTCFAGPSRPAARLTWLLNDQPIAPTSKWLSVRHQAQHHNRNLSTSELIETQLNLAFKLQLNYLSYLLKSSNPNDPNESNGIHSIRLRCTSKLVVEFSSETSILVSGGKTLIKRRQQQQQPQPSSSYSALSMNDEEPATTIATIGTNPAHHQRHQQLQFNPPNRNKNNQLQPVYKWPPKPTDETNFWLLTSTTTSGQPALSQDQADPLQAPRRVIHSNNQRQLIVWTSRQLRSQVEHIEQNVLRKSHANELESPIIEARTQLDDQPTAPQQQDDQPAATTSSDQFWTTSEVPEQEPDAADDQQQPSSRTTISPNDFGLHSISRDFELNESIQFNCNAQVFPAELESIRDVQMKWLINDKEINQTKINAFDGTKFYYADATLSAGPTNNPTTSRLLHESLSLPPTTTDHHQEDPHEQTNLRFAEPTDLRTGEIREKPLAIELTSSLIQLNGLNLKCKTIVEQPLIEYESQFVVSVATNPFIQAADHPTPTGRINHNPNGGRSNQVNASTRRPRPKFGAKQPNVYKVRPSSAAAASSAGLTVAISSLVGGVLLILL